MNTRNKGFYGWRLLTVLAVMNVLIQGFQNYGGHVMNAGMMADLHMSRAELGTGFSVYILCQGMVGPLASRLIRQWGQKLCMTVGGVLTLLSAACMALVPMSAPAYVVFFGLFGGVGTGLACGIAVNATVTKWFDARRELALAIVSGAAGVGGFLGQPLVTAVIAGCGSWRFGWYLALACVIAAFALMLLFMRNDPGTLGQTPYTAPTAGKVRAPSGYRTRESWSFREAAKTPLLWLLIAASLGATIPYMTMVNHHLVHFSNVGISSAAATAAVSLLALFGVGGHLLSSVICARYSSKYAFLAGLTSMLAGVALLDFGRSGTTAVLYSLFAGMGFGLTSVAMTCSIVNYFGPASYAGIQGSINPILVLCYSLGPALTGKLCDALGGYTVPFLILMLFTALALAAAFFIKPVQKKGAAPVVGEKARARPGL